MELRLTLNSLSSRKLSWSLPPSCSHRCVGEGACVSPRACRDVGSGFPPSTRVFRAGSPGCGTCVINTFTRGAIYFIGGFPFCFNTLHFCLFQKDSAWTSELSTSLEGAPCKGASGRTAWPASLPFYTACANSHRSSLLHQFSNPANSVAQPFVGAGSSAACTYNGTAGRFCPIPSAGLNLSQNLQGRQTT